MSEQLVSQLAEPVLREDWRQWEGKSVNGEFPLRRYLGGSEHSVVFLTEYDHREPQSAAIKLIDAGWAGAERQFKAWEIASALAHPNLIRIFQVGHCQIDGQRLFYAVMELADEDLSQIIPQRALTETEATEMLKPVLRALRYLHGEDWVHGHIKPANIMACGEQLKLSCDGLRDPGERIDVAGNYDPPESTYSPAGDVWSLGVTLVEVLTQRLPKWEHRSEDPEVPETLPGPLANVARNCLLVGLRRRWRASDVAKRLDPAIAGEIAAEPVRAGASHSPHRGLAVALILLVAVAGGISLRMRHRSAESGGAASRSSDMAVDANSEAVTPAQVHTVVVDASVKKQMPLTEKQRASVVIDEPVRPRLGYAEEATPVVAAQVVAARVVAPQVVAAQPAVADIAATPAAKGIVHQVLPAIPEKAQSTIRGTVRIGIQVSVDSGGNVTDATLDSPGPSPYFAKLTLQAAQQWKFAPSADGGHNWIIRFNLSSSGTEATARVSTP